jgi:antitoxin HicB
MRFAYPIDVRAMSPEEGGIVLVEFPDWNHAVTDGGDMVEALENARDCLEELIADRINRRESIPEPSPAGNRAVVGPEPGLALKAALWLGLRERGDTTADLANRLGDVSDQQVRRLLDPRLRTRPEAIHKALAALGKRVVVEVLDAA